MKRGGSQSLFSSSSNTTIRLLGNGGESDGRSVGSTHEFLMLESSRCANKCSFSRRCRVRFDGKEQGGSREKKRKEKKGKERKIIDHNLQDEYNRDGMLKGCPCTTTRV